jgi:hypothetical protein
VSFLICSSCFCHRRGVNDCRHGLLQEQGRNFLEWLFRSAGVCRLQGTAFPLTDLTSRIAARPCRNPRCLSFHQASRPVRTASATQVRRPIYTSAIGRWRVYERHLGPLIEEFGSAR